MGAEQPKHFPDQTGELLDPRIKVIREAISGTAAATWLDPAQAQLETMVAQTLGDVASSCGERWGSVTLFSQDNKVHVTRQGEVDNPISILDPHEITQLDIQPQLATKTLKKVLLDSLQMLGSNLTTLTELRAIQGKKGPSEPAGRQGRTVQNRSGITYRRAF